MSVDRSYLPVVVSIIGLIIDFCIKEDINWYDFYDKCNTITSIIGGLVLRTASSTFPWSVLNKNEC